MSRRTLIIAGCLALAVAALAIPLLMALDTEARNVTKGSIAYDSKLSDAIKAVPILGECQPPLYDHFEADADNPEAYTVSYLSLFKDQDVRAGLEFYFAEQACEPLQDGILGDGFACPDGSQAYFDLRPRETCTFVSVVLIPDP